MTVSIFSFSAHKVVQNFKIWHLSPKKQRTFFWCLFWDYLKNFLMWGSTILPDVSVEFSTNQVQFLDTNSILNFNFLLKWLQILWSLFFLKKLKNSPCHLKVLNLRVFWILKILLSFSFMLVLTKLINKTFLPSKTSNLLCSFLEV